MIAVPFASSFGVAALRRTASLQTDTFRASRAWLACWPRLGTARGHAEWRYVTTSYSEKTCISIGRTR